MAPRHGGIGPSTPDQQPVQLSRLVLIIVAILTALVLYVRLPAWWDVFGLVGLIAVSIAIGYLTYPLGGK